jgi:hypothetical protein
MSNVGLIAPLDGTIGEMDGPSLMLEKQFSELEVGDWFVFENMDFVKSEDDSAEYIDGESYIEIDPSEWVKVEAT